MGQVGDTIIYVSISQVLHLINSRITPIIERHLSVKWDLEKEEVLDAIFQLRTIVQRSVQVNKKVYACFVDYQKAFDRINHEKLLSIMEKSLSLIHI